MIGRLKCKLKMLLPCTQCSSLQWQCQPLARQQEPHATAFLWLSSSPVATQMSLCHLVSWGRVKSYLGIPCRMLDTISKGIVHVFRERLPKSMLRKLVETESYAFTLRGHSLWRSNPATWHNFSFWLMINIYPLLRLSLLNCWPLLPVGLAASAQLLSPPALPILLLSFQEILLFLWGSMWGFTLVPSCPGSPTSSLARFFLPLILFASVLSLLYYLVYYFVLATQLLPPDLVGTQTRALKLGPHLMPVSIKATGAPCPERSRGCQELVRGGTYKVVNVEGVTFWTHGMATKGSYLQVTQSSYSS